jgi:hypothetical protein
VGKIKNVKNVYYIYAFFTYMAVPKTHYLTFAIHEMGCQKPKRHELTRASAIWVLSSSSYLAQLKFVLIIACFFAIAGRFYGLVNT